MQGVESAWESVGKKRSFPSAILSASHSAGAKSKASRDSAASQEEGAGVLGVREELRGAEAITDTPRKGDNVSALSAKKFYNIVKNTFLAPTLETNFFLCFFSGVNRGQCAQ